MRSRIRYFTVRLVCALSLLAALSRAGPATMTSPAGGSQLNSSTVTFTWDLGSGQVDFWLDVGKTPGGKEYFSQNVKFLTSQDVSGLPGDGSPVYVRLWSATGAASSLTWTYTDYTYTATGVSKSNLFGPPHSDPLPPSTVFEWAQIPAATGYWLDVGTTPGGADLLSSAEGLQTSRAMGFSLGGTPIYVRLWTIKGAPPNQTWDYRDYTYTTSAMADLTDPPPGSALNGATVTFTWSGGKGVSHYAFQVGTQAGKNDLCNQTYPGSSVSSQTVSGLPTDGSTIYVKLWTYFPHEGSGYHYKSYTYTAAGGFEGTRSGATLQQGTATTFVDPTLAAATGAQPAGTSGTSSASPFTPVTSGSAIQPVAPTAVQPGSLFAVAGDPSAAAMANFPPVSGATPQSLTSSRSKTTWQDRATFAIAQTPDGALANYSPQLAAAGWTESSRSQSGDLGAQSLQITVDLQKSATRAHLVLSQSSAGATNLASTLTTLFPGDRAPSLEMGVTATPPTGATTSPMDRGAQDPANFPRLPGSVRTSYSSSSAATSTQEIANYTAKCFPPQADVFFAQSLAAAGWDDVSRYETITVASLSDQISMTWQNAKRSVVITITGSTSGGVTVRDIITTQQ